MSTNTINDISVRPRVLIADDSRIVRATLIKHIEGLFDFREATNGEEAWETLLLDQQIRIVITDLVMPKLDGYALLKRIRESKISRIRTIPVVVVSGSDEQEERDRAKAAGATELITKGIGTTQLLSRLDVLSKLAGSSDQFEDSLKVLVQHGSHINQLPISSIEMLRAQAAAMLSSALSMRQSFVLLSICVELRNNGGEGEMLTVPSAITEAIGQLLQRNIRQSDCVAMARESEFVVATGGVYFHSARNFAQRICEAIAHAELAKGEDMSFIASCGMVTLEEFGNDVKESDISFHSLHRIAHERALLGLCHAITGVVGADEEVTLRAQHPPQLKNTPITKDTPELTTLLTWLQEGKTDLVLQHIGQRTTKVHPLLELLLEKPKT